MKICKSCKTINSDSAKYCRSCGNALEKKSKGETIGTLLFWIIFIGGVMTCSILGVPFAATLIIAIVLIGLGVWVYSWFQYIV